MKITNQDIEQYYNSTREVDATYVEIHNISSTLVKFITGILKNRNKTLIIND